MRFLFFKLPTTWIQFIRFSIIGLIANTANFSLYIFFTRIGFEPKWVMTFLYLSASIFCFLCHWLWVFTNDQKLIAASGKYVLTQILGYMINLLFLLLFVDKLGYPHQLVLASAIVFVAGFLFFAQKYYVFPSVKQT